MSYIVTARKWRPQIFDEVVGQEHISRTIKNAIRNNRIAHAYIFAGPRGVGKTTTARIFAKAINCENLIDGEPCNNCEMCNSFLASQSLDIIEIDGASNRRIEEIRTLRESVKYAPTRGKYKVYIIDEVHMLTTESFNALLKTLEEPPSHTIFIFATTDIHKVPATIISRCQRFDFRRIELHDIKALLKKISDAESISIDDQSLTLIGKKADGALRDAQSLFDQIVSYCGNNIDAATISQMLNLIDEEIFFTISDSLLSKNFKAAFEVSAKIYENGWNFIDFMNGLVEHFRNIMTVVIRGNTDLVETAEIYKDRYMNYQTQFSEGDVLRLLNYLSKIQYELKSSTNQKLKIEIALCHLIGLEKTSTLTEILEQVKNAKGTISYQAPQTSIPTPLKSQAPLKTTIVAEPAQNIEVSKFAAPVVTTSDLNFDKVEAQWKNFLEVVNSEKFTLGSILAHVRPVDLNGNTLRLNLSHDEDEKIISGSGEYLSKKTKEIFGKKLDFEFENEKSASKGKNKRKGILDSANPQHSENKETTPLIDAIINQLGGKEIT
ncbi:MAG: DNA polymerase III subunit gamma/tau [bacterium]